MKGDVVAGWRLVSRATNTRPTVLRQHISTRIGASELSDWTAGLRAGFAEIGSEVITVDVTPPLAPQSPLRTLHAFTDRLGRGHVAATSARPDANGTDLTCRITPVARWAQNAVPEGSATTVVEAHLVVSGGTATTFGTVVRHGELARTELPGSPLTWTSVTTLPGLLFTNRGLGPRPRRDSPFVLVDRPSLNAVLATPAADANQVRRALSAPDLPTDTSADIAALTRGLTAWWSLAWMRGTATETYTDDTPWHTATAVTTGRLEILDAGDAGLWQVTNAPEPLLADWHADGDPAATPVVLRRTSATDVFAALARFTV